MSALTLQYTHLRERILLGSVSIKKDEYPFAAFCIGYLLAKTQVPTQLIFEFLEEIDNLAKTKIFSQIIVKQLIQVFQDFPKEAEKIVDTLKEISRGKMVNIIGWIEAFYNEELHAERKIKEEQPIQVIPNTIELQNQGTQQLDDLFQPTQKEAEIEKQIKRRQKQDIEFARKMQEEFDKENQHVGEEEDAPCEICYVSLFGGDVEVLECGHLYHKECLSESFKISISSNSFPLRCPNDECKKQVAERDLRNIFNKQLYEKYQGHTLKAYADEHGDSISWCPTADCGYMFFYQKGDQERFQCLQCKKQYCLNCRVDWHEGMSCKEYKITNTISEDDEKFINFVKGKKFKQCPKCKFWVEKNEGCDHMTCKCKFQFCYKCGGVYMKCECVEKARVDMQNRRREAEQRMRRKQERKDELLKKRKQREQKQRQKERIKEQEKSKRDDEVNRRSRRRK